MSKLLSVIPLLCLLLLTACQGKTNAPAIQDGDFSASMGSSFSVQSSDAAPSYENMFEQIRAWTPGIRWSSAEQGTFARATLGITASKVPASTVQGYSMKGSRWDAAWYAAFDAKMTADGWAPYLPVNADGPEESRFGYVRNDGDSLRFLIVSSVGFGCEAVDTENKVCKRYETHVFYTDPIRESQFIRP